MHRRRQSWLKCNHIIREHIEECMLNIVLYCTASVHVGCPNVPLVVSVVRELSHSCHHNSSGSNSRGVGGSSPSTSPSPASSEVIDTSCRGCLERVRWAISSSVLVGPSLALSTCRVTNHFKRCWQSQQNSTKTVTFKEKFKPMTLPFLGDALTN